MSASGDAYGQWFCIQRHLLSAIFRSLHVGARNFRSWRYLDLPPCTWDVCFPETATSARVTDMGARSGPAPPPAFLRQIPTPLDPLLIRCGLAAH
jgi:hypothetical protein